METLGVFVAKKTPFVKLVKKRAGTAFVVVYQSESQHGGGIVKGNREGKHKSTVGHENMLLIIGLSGPPPHSLFDLIMVFCTLVLSSIQSALKCFCQLALLACPAMEKTNELPPLSTFCYEISQMLVKNDTFQQPS